MQISQLNTLSFPKGKHPRCELTNVPATVELQPDNADIKLFYASKEHAEQAWYGIMNKIAPLVGPLRANADVIGSEEDRAKREYTLTLSKKAVVEVCELESSNFLSGGKHELAIPGALQALSFLRELYGDGAMEMIPPLLLLAEANLGLGRFQQADEFLSLANWSVLKNPNCTNATRSQLHRNFGKLYSAQGKLNEALAELAKDIYCSSNEFGPEHINTSSGYYYMASIFYTQHRIENALAFYDKVVDIWYKFLASARRDSTLLSSLTTTQLTEAKDMLNFVLQTRGKLLGVQHIATGEVRFTLGLLHLGRGEVEKARDYVSTAAEVYSKHLGPEHASTRDVFGLLHTLNQEPEVDT